MSDSAAEIDWFVPGLLAGTPALKQEMGHNSHKIFRSEEGRPNKTLLPDWTLMGGNIVHTFSF